MTVVKREQQKRDRKEMMERLQRANRNELHDLNAQEQMQMLRIQSHVCWRCFMYGFLSALASGSAELLVGWTLDTSDGMHAGNSYLAPNATCDKDPDTCLDLPVESMAQYWLWAFVIPIAVASVFEIGAIYWDSLRSAMKFVGVVGLQLLPLNDERLFIALSITRAVLELGNEENAMTGVLDPLTEVSKWRMALCGLLYKARIGISNFVMKIGLKRVVSRSVARSSLPFVAIVGTAVWNGLTARGLMTEARVRAMGVASSVELSNVIIERFITAEMTALGKLQAARAVACTVVRKQSEYASTLPVACDSSNVSDRLLAFTALHPNHHHLLLHILHRLELEDHKALVEHCKFTKQSVVACL